LGKWGQFSVYALDFKVDGSGIFTIDVDGPMPATSPSFRIGAPEQLYSQGFGERAEFLSE
jgi:hypothetical protein